MVMPFDDKNDPNDHSEPTGRPASDRTGRNHESRFSQVQRESRQRRAEADQRSAERRAAELQEIARQVAARTPKSKPPEAAKPVANEESPAPEKKDGAVNE